MKKNLSKKQQIRSLQILIASTEENIKYLTILSNATNAQLFESEKAIITKIVHIQNKQKNRENSLQGPVHLAAQKVYHKISEKVENLQLANLTKHLTYVRQTLYARQNGTFNKGLTNLEQQLERYNTELKILQGTRQVFTAEK